MSKRVLINTVGSLGDLHPYIALGHSLQSRGVHVRFATANEYRARLLKEGFEFAPVRPHLDSTDETLAARVMDTNKGTKFIFNEIVFANFQSNFEDVLAASKDVDLLFTGSLGYGTPLVAEKTGIPWVSSVLAPISLFSRVDFPVFSNFPGIARFLGKVPPMAEVFMSLTRSMTDSWAKPAYELRKKLGLPRGPNPVMEGVFSPRRALGLYSSTFAPPRRDRPAAFEATGFIFHDRRDVASALPIAVAEFLDAGEAPLIFTLGSAAHKVPGGFYETGYHVTKLLSQRAILVTGKTMPQFPASSRILEVEYLPFSQVFPRAKLVVHHGGIGTTAQTLRAGVPMLGVPIAHDQHDNFDHAKRLGTAEYFDKRSHFTIKKATKRLAQMLDDKSYAENARAVAQKIRAEKGLEAAIAELLRFL